MGHNNNHEGNVSFQGDDEETRDSNGGGCDVNVALKAR